MKSARIILLFVIAALSLPAIGDVSVRGYQRNDGTYVQPSHRSNPNNNTNDNWSTKGNRNPYTGEEGTKNPNNQNNWR